MKKRKRKMKHNKGSDHHGNPSSDKPISGEVKVHGSVQVTETEGAIHQHAAEREDDDSYKKATRDYEKSYLLVSRLLLFVTACYFAATTAILIYTRRAANAAKDSAYTAGVALTDAKNSFRLQNRPYVIADGTAYFLTDKAGKPAMNFANVNYKNVGKTPAQDVFIIPKFKTVRIGGGKHTFEELASSIDKIFQLIIDNDNKIPSKYDLIDKSDMAPEAPDAFITQELKGEDALIFPKERAGIISGDILLIYMGRVHYKGYEGTETYTTDFCFYFFGQDTKIWHFCPKHNSIR